MKYLVTLFSFMLVLTDIPSYPIHNRLVIGWWSAAAWTEFRLRQQVADAPSQWTRNAKVIDIFRFFGKLLGHDISVLIGVWRLQSFAYMSVFQPSIAVFG